MRAEGRRALRTGNAHAVLAAALAFVTGASTAGAAPDPLIHEDSGAVVNWRRGVVSATAGAAPDHRTPSADVARSGAERRARASARDRIGEALRRLPLGGGRKLDDGAVTRAIERARVSDIDYQSNGGVMVTMEVTFGSWDAPAPATDKADRPDGSTPGADAAISSPSPSLPGAPATALSLPEGRLGAAPVVVVGGREVEPSSVRYATGAPPSGSPRPLKAKTDKQGRLVIEGGAAGEFAARPLVIYVHKNPPMNTRLPTRLLLIAAVLASGANRVWAQAAGGVTAPPPAAPVPGQEAAAPLPPIATSSWGGRIGAAEVSIVGGNMASARERALTEAMKQAVDQALTTAFPEARTQQPKTVTQVLGRARTYVRRYRTIEEGERGRGLYALKIEADVDEAGLARAFDKATTGGGAAPTGAAAASAAPAYFLVGAGVADALAAAARGFAASGARVQQAPADVTDPSKAVELAARAGSTMVAFVSGTATAEGKVRGPGIESAACSLSVRVLAAGSGLAVADESESARGFSERADGARAECFQRAAALAIPRLVPAAGARGPADVRTVVVDADVVEAGAVQALVRQLRGIGSVSAIEVRRVSVGRVELWVRSRMAASALSAALERDTGGTLAVTGAQVSGDLVHLRARLREVTPVAAPTPGSAAQQPGVAPVPTPPPKGPTP